MFEWPDNDWVDVEISIGGHIENVGTGHKTRHSRNTQEAIKPDEEGLLTIFYRSDELVYCFGWMDFSVSAKMWVAVIKSLKFYSCSLNYCHKYITTAPK